MEETRRMQRVDELTDIARTGGPDTSHAIKTIAGALAEALGPTSHERAVAEEIKKHGTKTPEKTEVPPDRAAMAAARGDALDEASAREVEQEREAREGRAVPVGNAGERPEGDKEPATT